MEAAGDRFRTDRTDSRALFGPARDTQHVRSPGPAGRNEGELGLRVNDPCPEEAVALPATGCLQPLMQYTSRGRQGSDVAFLVRRVRDALRADRLQCVGTSATLAG